MIRDYVCIDLETTGLRPKADRIIEIGAVRVRNGQVAERFQRLVNPRMKLDERVIQLTGITAEELTDQPELSLILPEVEAFLGEDILLGHNLIFDYAFLKRAFINHKRTFERQGVDTLRIARTCVNDCESKKLENLCLHFGIVHQAHRALGDAIATMQLYEKLFAEYGSQKEELFGAKPLLYRIKKETPVTKVQVEQIQRLIKKYRINLTIEPESLTRNEASRYLDQIYAAYGR